MNLEHFGAIVADPCTKDQYDDNVFLSGTYSVSKQT